MSGRPRVYNSWAANPTGLGGTVAIVTRGTLSGSAALQIDTRSATRGRFVYQDLRDQSACFTWTFHVFPEQGKNTAEIFFDWRNESGPLKSVSVLTYDDTGIAMTAWDGSKTFPRPLAKRKWHSIVIEGNADTRTQRLSVDGNVYGDIVATDTITAPDIIILGDVAGSAFHGLFTYDDVSLVSRACASPIAAASPSAVASAAPVAHSAGGFPLWIVALIVAIILLLLWLYIRSRRARV